MRKTSGALVWVTPPPRPSTFRPTMTYTHGCSCRQILDSRRGARTEKLTTLGQYLFGCTKGTLENWHEG